MLSAIGAMIRGQAAAAEALAQAASRGTQQPAMQTDQDTEHVAQIEQDDRICCLLTMLLVLKTCKEVLPLSLSGLPVQTLVLNLVSS